MENYSFSVPHICIETVHVTRPTLFNLCIETMSPCVYTHTPILYDYHYLLTHNLQELKHLLQSATRERS